MRVRGHIGLRIGTRLVVQSRFAECAPHPIEHGIARCAILRGDVLQARAPLRTKSARRPMPRSIASFDAA